MITRLTPPSARYVITEEGGGVGYGKDERENGNDGGIPRHCSGSCHRSEWGSRICPVAIPFHTEAVFPQRRGSDIRLLVPTPLHHRISLAHLFQLQCVAEKRVEEVDSMRRAVRRRTCSPPPGRVRKSNTSQSGAISHTSPDLNLSSSSIHLSSGRGGMEEDLTCDGSEFSGGEEGNASGTDPESGSERISSRSGGTYLQQGDDR